MHRIATSLRADTDQYLCTNTSIYMQSPSCHDVPASPWSMLPGISDPARQQPADLFYCNENYINGLDWLGNDRFAQAKPARPPSCSVKSWTQVVNEKNASQGLTDWHWGSPPAFCWRGAYRVPLCISGGAASAHRQRPGRQPPATACRARVPAKAGPRCLTVPSRCPRCGCPTHIQRYSD